MTDNLLKAALEYAADGWPVFPCRHDKTPYTVHGVLDATTDEKKIREWWAKWPGANIGFHPSPAGFAVLDYDPGSKPEAVKKQLGLRPTHLIAGTPRGGTHEYYTLDENEVVPSSASRIAEKVDVRSFHGYVLLPPSRTKDGVYGWVEEGKAAYRSQEFIEASSKRTEKDKNRDNWIIEPDLEENKLLAASWLRGETKIGGAVCEVAIEGQGGDHVTFATAAMMKSCGLSEGTALEVMWENWNDRCDPPWEYEELQIKVGNGYSYNSSPPGNVTSAYRVALKQAMFTPIETREFGGGKERTGGKFRAVDSDGIEGIAPPSWIIPDMIPEDSYCMLVGPPGSYKSALALDIALTLATAGPALAAEWKGATPEALGYGPVLYIAGEGRGGFRNRVEAWHKFHFGKKRAKVPFVLLDPVPHVTDESIDALVKLAQEFYPSYRLVVLDTVARSMQGVNENAQENATAFTALVDALRKQLGATVLALHHTGWENAERGRGSSAFLGDVDTLMVIAKPDRGQAELKMIKQKDWQEWEESRWYSIQTVKLGTDREGFVMTPGERPAKITKGGSSEKITQSEVEHMVLETLKANTGQEFSDRQLAVAVAYQHGRGEESVRVWLKRLRTDESSPLHPLYDPTPKKQKWAWRGMAN